jgi:predicted nucleic acid-binding protein
MNDKFFLDTNLFIYSFDGAPSAKARRATELIRGAIETRKGVVSYQVVQEFFNVALRRFDNPMRLDDAEQYLAMVFRPLLAVSASLALYHEALDVFRRYGVSWYDALIVAAALQAQCAILYSEDLQDGQHIANLEIRNPFQ